MVAVVSGSSLGLFNSSLALMGSGGGVGDSKEGRATERVYVNSSTGNLIVQARDGSLSALGLDLALVRTYNSQGLLNDDNGDNWRLGVQESLSGLTGTVNTAGSTITKTFGDGAAIVYRYDATLGYYVSSDGDGANDTLTYNSGTSQWTWTDGSARAAEVYDSSGRLLSSRDADGNTITYTYTGNLLTQITDASGQNTFLDYTGNNLTQIRVVSQGVTQTITRYTYDAQNRLSQVRVDLSPEDNSIADGKVFLTTYTYDGTSTRIASISQGDEVSVGGTVSFTYQLLDGQYRIKTYTDGEGQVTTCTYTLPSGAGSSSVTATANSGVLSTTEQQSTSNTYNLDSGALTGTVQTYDLNTGALTPGSGTNVLQNFVTQTNVGAAQGEAVIYTIDVPAGMSQLYINLDASAGSSGDAALYVSHGVSPTPTSWDAASDHDYTGNYLKESVNIENPAAGTWYIAVYANSTFQGAQLRADYQAGTDQIVTLTPEQAVSDVEGADGSIRRFSFQIAPGTSDLQLALSGPQDDGDLYLSYGAPVDLGAPDYASEGGTVDEVIDVANPQAGTWYALVKSYTYVSNARLILHTNLGANTPPGVEGGAAQSTTAGATVNLSATASDAISYEWTQIEGPPVTLSSTTSAAVSFTAPNVSSTTQLSFRVRVTDADGASNTDVVHVTVAAPVMGYTIPAGATWRSIANALYGVDSPYAATALQTALGNPPLTAGNRLTTLPPTLSVTTVLQNFVTTSVGASAGEWVYYTIDVPTGMSQLYVNLDASAGSSGDAALYVAHGAPPTSISYDAVSDNDYTGNYLKESVNLDNPAAGTWYIGVYANSNFQLARLRADYQAGTDQIVTLTPEQAVNDIEGVGGSIRQFSFQIAPGTSDLQLALSGPQDDGDLYLSYGAPVDLGAPDYASEGGTVDEVINVPNPQAGTWYALVKSYTYVSDARLILHTNLGANTAPYVEATASQQTTPGATVTLSIPWAGDAEGAVTSEWTQIEGPSVTLSSSTSPTVTFTAPNVSTPTQLSFRVRVTDQQGASDADVVHVTVVPPSLGYTIPAGATWQSVATALYGVNSVDAGNALQAALGNPPLTAGSRLVNLPPTLTVTTTTTVTVPAYYTVGAGDTWTSLTQAIYGTSDPSAVAALQSVTGSPTLTAGLHLSVPLTLTYTTSGGPTVYLQTDVSDPLGLVTSFANDTSGRLVGLLSPTTGGARIEQRFSYDDAGNLTQTIEDPSGVNRITNYQYDANGNLTLTRDALGNTVTRTYSADNQLLTETLYTVPDPDGGGAGQPSGPLSTRYAYDSEDHLRFVITAEGRVTEHRYNAAGSHTSTIVYTGGRYDVSALAPTTALTESQLTTWASTQDLTLIERTDYAYDFRGNVSSATAYASTDSAGNGVPTGASVTRFVYDQRGNLLSTIDPRGETTTGDPNDYVTTFTYDGLGRVLSSVRWTSAGNVTTLNNAYNDGTRTQTTTQPNGLVTTTVYDRVGRVVTVSASNGQPLGTTTYAYDADGRLRMVTDPLGIKTHYVYDEAGRKIFSVDGNGTLTELIYDRLSNVVKTVQYAVAANTSLLVDGNGNPLATVDTTLLRSSANGQPAQNRITRAVYDAVHRVAYTIDATGAVTKNIYDGASRLTDQLQYATTVAISASIDELTLAADGSISGVILTTSADDRLSRSFYDNDGRVVGTLDGAGYLTRYVYDAAGQRIQTIAYANATQASLRTTGTLSALEGSITADAAHDIVTYVFYDGEGRRVGALDGEKFLTQWVYDVAGNVVQEIRYPTARTFTGMPTLAGVLPGTTTGAHITSYQYDELSRVTLETNFENVQTQYTYDNVGNLVQTTRALGTPDARVAQARYDSLGRVTAELTAEGNAQIAAITNPTQAQIDNIWSQYAVQYAYDKDGRRISATDQYGNVTLFFYDADGRQRFSVTCVAGGLGEVTEQRYNALGQLTDRIAYVNRVSTSGFASGDVNGTLTGTVASAVASIADATKDAHTTYTYTPGGSVATETTAEGGSITRTYNAFGELGSSSQLIDTLPTTTTLDHLYTYDQRGLLLTTRWDPSGLNVTDTRTYDAFGRLKTDTDARGNLTQYAYDRMGRTVQVTDPFSKTDTTTYDAFSRVLTTTDKLNQTTQYAYNDASRSVTVTTPEGIQVTTVHNVHGQTATITDARGNVTSHEYDANGQLKRVYDANGNIYQQTYDRAGRGVDSIDANGVITRVTYDAASRAYTRTVDPGGLNLTTTYAYDGEGRTISVTDERGVVTQTAYDRDGQVTSVTVDAAGLNLKTTYTYDKRGGLKVTTEGTGSSNPRTVTYAYDKLGRRISDTVVLGNGQPDAVTQYKYDASGNVTRKIDARGYSTWYVYDAADRLRYTIDALGGVTQTTYDDEGRVTATRRHASKVNYTASLGDVVTLASLSTLGTPATSNADRIEETVYDRDGRAVYTVDTIDASGNGLVTQKDYDGNGNVVHQRVYANAIASSVVRSATAVASALSPTTSDRESFSTYDIRNRATFDIDAAGDVTRNEYDHAGNVVARTQFATTRATTSAPTDAQMVTWAGSNSNAADRVTRYWYDASGRKVFTLDAEGYLSETRYTDATRTEEAFGYLTRPSTTLTGGSTLAQVGAAIITNASDRYTRTEYDTGGRVAKVTDAYGNFEQYTYDAVGNRLSYRNQKGSVWDYSYDANHRLIEELSPAVDIWATDATLSGGQANARISTRMTYDALGNVLTRTEAYGRPEARTTTYEYDALGRQTRTIFPPINVYSAPAGDETRAGTAVVRAETTVTSPDTVLTYNTLGDAVVNRDVAGNYTHKVYDSLGRVKYDIDAKQYVTEHVYDSFGNETSTIRYASAVYTGPLVQNGPSLDLAAEWTTADITARLTAQSSADRTLTRQYDRVNRVTQVTQPAAFDFLPNAGSTPGGTSYPGIGAATLYDYNAFGEVTRQRQLVSPGTYADTYWYFDRRGLRTAQVDPRGYLSISEYDAIGNQTRTVEYAKALGAPPTTPGGAYSGLSTSTPAVNPGDPAGYDRETLYTYDRLNRLKTESLVNVEYTTISGDVTTTVTNGTRTTTYDYDAVGNRTAITDATGAVTYTYYDVLGRVVGVAEPARDVDGTNTTTINFSWAVSGQQESFAYRRQGISTWTTLSVSGSASLGALANGTYDWSYSYAVLDPIYGQVLSQGSAAGTFTVNGAASSWTETTNNNAPAMTFSATPPPPDSTTTVTPYTEMLRDVFGNLVIQVQWGGGATGVSAAGATKVSVPATDRVTRILVDSYGHDLRTTDAEGGVDEKSYTVRGDLAKEWQLVTNNDGGTDALVTIYQYDALGQQTAMIEPGRLDSIQQVVRTDVTYNAFGEIVAKAVNSTPTEYYDYDQAGRVWRTNAGDGVSKVYLYDLLGNNTAEIRSQTKDLKSDPSITNAQQALALGGADQMRIETRYDLMGHALEQREVTFQAPAAQESIGTSILFGNLLMPDPPNAVYQQVTYADMYSSYTYYVVNPTDYANGGGYYQVAPPSASNPSGTYARVDQASYSISQRGFIYWAAPVQQGLTKTFEYRVSGGSTWSTLGVNQVNSTQIGVDISALANGSYEFRVSYTRAGDSSAYAIETGTFSVNNAQITTLSAASGAAVGSINVTSATLSGTSLTVTWDPGPAGTSTLEVRASGSPTWQSVTGTLTGDGIYAPFTMTATATGLTPGNYDYRITYTSNGEITAIGTGTIAVSSPTSSTTGTATPAASWGNAIGALTASRNISVSPGAAVGGISVLGASISGSSLYVTWDAPAAGSSTLEVKPTSSSTWQSVAGTFVPADMYTPQYTYATATGIGPGTYDYRITYTSNGVTTAIGVGTFSVSSPTSSTTGSATPSASWGNAIGPLSASTSTSSGGATTISYSWAPTGYTEIFEWAPHGTSSWSSVSGSGSANLGALANGTYDWTLIYGTVDPIYGTWYQAGSASGTLVVNGASSSSTQTSGSPACVMTATTPPPVVTTYLSWPIDASIQGTPTFYYRPSGGSWTTLGIGSAGGYYQVAANNLSGSYDWQIVYTATDGYNYWTTASAQGTFSVSGSTATVTSQTGTPSYLSGVTASGSNLYWSRAVQSGESLTVTLNGSTSLTPQTSDGTNYWASFNGLASGTYTYEIAYWYAGSKRVVGSGSLSITTTTNPSTVSMGAPSSVGTISGFQTVASTQVGWTTAASGGDTVTFRYRPSGSSTWTGSLAPFAWSTGYAVDFGTGLSGSYDYEVTYTHSGQSTPYRIAYGTTVITPALSWPIDSSIAGTPAFYYRPVGSSSWSSLSIGAVGGVYQVPVSGLSGNYEWQVVYTATDGYSYWTTASAQGTFTVSGSTATVTSQTGTPSYLSGVTASGNRLYWSRALQSGDTLTVTVGGTSLTPQTSDGTNYSASFDGFASGTYSYEIAYWKNGSKYVVGSGSVSITTTVTPSSATMSTPTSVGQITGFYDAGNGLLAWTTPSSGGTVQFRWRQAGATSWAGTLTPTAYGAAYAVNLDSPTPISGAIEYEVQYIDANGAPYKIGYGTTTISRAIQTTASVADTTSTTLAPISVTPRLQQTFDRWGDILTSISAALAQTNYRYNQFGSVAEVQLPTTDIVSTINAGVAEYFATRPIQRNYFDILGRVIATRDGDANRLANGKMNKVQYNAAGQVLSETHADDTTKTYVYDTFGEQIQVTDGLGYRTRMAYDRTGNLTAQAHELSASGFASANASDMTAANSSSTVRNDYTYDRAGHRLSETTGEVMNGTSNAETLRYWYDLRGNVIKTTTPRGRATTYEYDAFGNKTLERNANNDTQQWTYDAYGRVLNTTDLGGAVTTFNYDAISKFLTSQTSTLGQNITYQYDAAGHLIEMSESSVAASGSGLQNVTRDTQYSYDAAGRRSRERVVIDGLVHQDTHITYDALDRISQLSDLRYRLTYRYDDSGNRTRIKATYYDHAGIAQVQDLWYTYDAMNRVLVSQGVNSAGDTEASGTIGVSTTQGVQLTYDAKGQRTSARQFGQKLNLVDGVYSYTNDYSTETYGYDGAGHLMTVERSMAQTTSGVTTQTTLRTDMFTYDKVGRELTDVSSEFETVNGTLTSVGRSRASNYDDDGRMMNQTTARNGVKESYVVYGDSTYTQPGTVTYVDPWTGQTVSYSWGGSYTPGYDAAGVLRGYIVQVYNTGTSDANDIAYTTTYSFSYRNGASYQQTGETASSAAGSGYTGSVPQSGSTSRTYDVDGALVATSDSRDTSKNRYFANDAQGQAITVVQGQYDGQSGRWTATQAFQYALENTGQYNATHSQHFFFAQGQQVGSYGQLADSSGAFKANFDVNYTPVSDRYPDSAPSEVVAQKGDTLRLIAARVFGDQNLWYLIAQENGLTDPDAQIDPGTVLRIPNEVVSLSNTASSFKPFDAQAAIGDTSPTQPMPPQPKPKKKKGCGILGQILMIVVVIVVTIYTAGAMTAAAGSSFGTIMSTGVSTLAGGLSAATVTAAAVGSAAGQLAGMAMGVQDKFSWKGVALAAVGAAVGGALSGSAKFASIVDKVSLGNEYVAAGLSAAAGNAVTQGVSVAVGLQPKFDWKSVAASAVAAPLAKLASDKVGAWASPGGKTAYDQAVKSGTYTAGRLAGDAAASMTTAAVRSAFGGKFDVSQVTADIFGNALANSIVSKISNNHVLRSLGLTDAPRAIQEYALLAHGQGIPDADIRDAIQDEHIGTMLNDKQRMYDALGGRSLEDRRVTDAERAEALRKVYGYSVSIEMVTSDGLPTPDQALRDQADRETPNDLLRGQDQNSVPFKLGVGASWAVEKIGGGLSGAIEYAGPWKVRAALVATQFAFGGIPKTAINLALDNTVGNALRSLSAPLRERFADFLAARAFDARNNDELQAVRPATSALADMTTDFAIGMALGGATDNIVAAAKSFGRDSATAAEALTETRVANFGDARDEYGLRGTDGRFKTDPARPVSSLIRPGLRSETRQTIEANHPFGRDAEGRFLDANGMPIKEPTYGHEYGWENRRIIAAGEELGLTQEQLNNYVNARPEHFFIEEKAVNLSHVSEMPGVDNIDHVVRDMRKFFGK